MSGNEPIVITRKQAKSQINQFGISLLLYSIFYTIFCNSDLLVKYLGVEAFRGYDPQEITLIFGILLLLFVGLVPFRISAKKLDLDIKDYLKEPDLSKDKNLALICLGIGIQLITISVSMLFYFYFHTRMPSYDFLGNFNTTVNIIKNVLYFFLFVILQPIFDEYIFRGIIQRQLGHYGRYFGALASAFLYAIVQGNLVGAITSFFVGWYLSLVTLRYHSIKPGIRIHMAIAAFGFLVDVLPSKYLWVISLLIGFVYIVSALTIFQKRVSTKTGGQKAMNGKLWKILLSSWSIVGVIIIFLVNVWFSFA